jgi:hypothetical protein
LSSKYLRVLVRLRSPFWYRLIGFFGVVVTTVCFLESKILATRAMGLVCSTLTVFLYLMRIMGPTRWCRGRVCLNTPFPANLDILLYFGFGSLGRAMMCLAALRWAK